MDGALGSSEIRPGTKLFAPQARLVTPEGEPITIGRQPISADIMSATVTLTHTDVSQVEVVLNNQRHDANHGLVTPTWRYNRLDTLSFGTRVRVDFRYGNEGWTPMILARITDVVFLFPSAAGAQITLKGEDLLSLLKAKPAKDESYKEKHEIDMVEAELKSSSSGLTLANRPQPAFAEPLKLVTHEQAKSYKQFIDAFAERMDYEVFVAFDDASPGSAKGADARSVSLHFEPARSGTLDKVVTLKWGRDIIEFKPAFKVWDVLTDAVARGSLPRKRGTFSAEVKLADAIKGDLHTAKGGAAPIPADQARARAFNGENRPEQNSEQISVSNIDEERAKLQATAVLRKSARQFLTAELSTVGLTGLRPGIHVTLEGLYAPFDGVYYVTDTVHTLSAAGYITKTSLRRPGMLDPSSYPKE